ncbi:hypothetical protein [Devosia sp.]|uniref:hypothetical protein n=1 Tax=Devosia sp. TaxID=1871048 RepID=UPI0035AF4119
MAAAVLGGRSGFARGFGLASSIRFRVSLNIVSPSLGVSGMPDPSIDLPALHRARLRGKSGQITIPAIPKDLPHHLGMVAAMHGELDRVFHQFYLACEGACPEPSKDKQAQRYGMNRLANSAIAKCKSVFSDHPEVSVALVGMCNRAKAFEKQRNIVLHGRYVANFPKAGGPITLSVVGKFGGQDTSVDFSVDDVIQLWHDIGCLTGDFESLLHGPRSPLSSAQTQIARDRLQPYYRPRPTLPTHPRRHLASVE